MTTALHLLFLPAHADGATRELRMDAAGKIVPTLPPGTACRRVLAVPAIELTLHRLALPALSAAQARAAAMLQLQGKLASHRDQLEWSVAKDGEASWVAVFNRERMADWLARASALGFVPDSVVPDCLLLPEMEVPGQVHVAVDGDYVRARGQGIAFSAEATLAECLLRSTELEPVTLEAGQADANLFHTASRPALELLLPAGNKAGTAGRPSLRRLGALAAVLLLSPLLIWTSEGFWHEGASNRVHARANNALLAVAPDATGEGSPLSRALAALARREAPDRFGQLAAPLLEAHRQVPGARLTRLALGTDGVLEASLRHDQPEQLETLRDALAQRGVSLAQAGSAMEGGQHMTRIVLSASP